MRVLLSIFILLLPMKAAIGQFLKPKIVGQKELSTRQGQPIAIELTDLYVEEKDEGGSAGGEEQQAGDNGDGHDKGHKHDKGEKGDKGKNHHGRTMSYPDGYKLKISSGKDYSVSENIVTPDASFAGVLTVKVKVENERYASNKFDLKISVVAASANVAPVITGQLPLSTGMNDPLTVSLSDLLVTDPDNSYPSGYTLALSQGEHFAAEGNVVTPATDYTGTLTVKAIVNDGTDDSAPFDLKIDVVAAINVPPQIVGQIPISISVNQTVTITPLQLSVVDPDNDYPEGFSMTVFPGEHYTVDQLTVFPEKGFAGNLIVKVSVNDGTSSSNVYDLKITVVAAPNAKPVISGQTELKVVQGESAEIKLQNLMVDDPDNAYPEDFTLTVYEGDHYALSINTITPESSFTGMLAVNVTVNDGQTSSDPFSLKIEVISKGRLEITGQAFLQIPEDSSLTLGLSDLVVNDPDQAYPQGFSLHVNPGDNYDVVNTTIKPHRDFFGKLTLSVAISSAASSSPVYSLVLLVTPVNDAPELTSLEQAPLVVNGSAPVAVSSSVEVTDRDDDHLLYGEVRIDAASYRRGQEKLLFDVPENINGVFEADSGMLFLFGRASIAEYQDVLRSVKYTFADSSASSQPATSKKIIFKVSDGKNTSLAGERMIVFNTESGLDIPGAFTPNNDFANDTWKITPRSELDDMDTRICVYDVKGNVVFQCSGFQTEWDGQFNGSPLPAGVYFYTIEMRHSQKMINYKGTVAILR